VSLGRIIRPAVGDPLKLPTLAFRIDSETSISGTVDSALDSVGDQSTFARNISNTSGAGSRPVWALTVNAGANSFKSGTKHGIDLEGGTDWLSLTGLDTAATFTCPTAMTVWHVTRQSAGTTTTNNAANTPQNVLGTVGTTVTTHTSVGFSGGTPRFMAWNGASLSTYNGTTAALSDGSPHSVCWVYSGTTLICYVDGVQDSSQTVTAYQSTNGFSGIGGHGNTDGLIGAIAEVMVWNATLTASQVKQIHNRAVTTWF
jgi:hypothetical protein